MLADLDSLEKRVDALEKRIRGQDKEAKETLDLVNRALALLREGKPARFIERKPEEEKLFRSLGLLTPSPCFTSAMSTRLRPRPATRIRALSRGAREERRRGLGRHLGQDRGRDRGAAARGARRISSPTSGSKEAGLNRLIRAGYGLLDLVTFFTAGPKEARAWTVIARRRARRRRPA